MLLLKLLVGTIISKGNDVNIEQTITIDNTISAPISKGDIIGKISYSLNGDILSECNLIANEDVAKMNIISMDKFVLDNWLNLLR